MAWNRQKKAKSTAQRFWSAIFRAMVQPKNLSAQFDYVAVEIGFETKSVPCVSVLKSLHKNTVSSFLIWEHRRRVWICLPWQPFANYICFSLSSLEELQIATDILRMCQLTQHIQLQNANEIYVGCFTSFNIHNYKMKTKRTIQTTTELPGLLQIKNIYKKLAGVHFPTKQPMLNFCNVAQSSSFCRCYFIGDPPGRPAKPSNRLKAAKPVSSLQLT